MLRFLLKRRRGNDLPGSSHAWFETVDIDVPELEKLLTRGGLSPTEFDITDLMGVEVRIHNATGAREFWRVYAAYSDGITVNDDDAGNDLQRAMDIAEETQESSMDTQVHLRRIREITLSDEVLFRAKGPSDG